MMQTEEEQGVCCHPSPSGDSAPPKNSSTGACEIGETLAVRKEAHDA